MISYTPMPVKHHNLFVTEMKFMHGDADFYTDNEYYTDTEEETEALWNLLTLLSRERKYRRIGDRYEGDQILRELSSNTTFVKTFYGEDAHGWYQEYLTEHPNLTDYSLADYLTAQCDFDWPIDKTNWTDRCALDGFVTYWYDENGTQFKVTVS